ncbi:MAG TPA: carbonic anhydrase [Ktedonobacterales bacterium]
MVIDEILAANETFGSKHQPAQLSHLPRRRMAVVTCMDTRLTHLFEEALGLHRGEVLQLRTAGATIPEGQEINGDLIRSLAGAIYLLGVREVAVIGHTECGLSHGDLGHVTASMQALGVDPAAFPEQGDDLLRWLGTFHDVRANTARTARAIRTSPYLPRGIPVHALVIDVHSGKLEMIERGE